MRRLLGIALAIGVVVPVAVRTQTAPPARVIVILKHDVSLAASAGAYVADARLADQTRFGYESHALVGAVLGPVLLLLAAFGARHRVLPNAIVLPSVLLVALIVAAADPAGFLEHLAEVAVKETRKTGVFVLPGLGRLKKVQRKARMGRNPQTGEPIKIPAKTTAKFYLAKAVKDSIAPKR